MKRLHGAGDVLRGSGGDVHGQEVPAAGVRLCRSRGDAGVVDGGGGGCGLGVVGWYGGFTLGDVEVGDAVGGWLAEGFSRRRGVLGEGFLRSGATGGVGSGPLRATCCAAGGIGIAARVVGVGVVCVAERATNGARLALEPVVALFTAGQYASLLLEVRHGDDGECCRGVVCRGVVVYFVDVHGGVENVRFEDFCESYVSALTGKMEGMRR